MNVVMGRTDEFETCDQEVQSFMELYFRLNAQDIAQELVRAR